MIFFLDYHLYGFYKSIWKLNLEMLELIQIMIWEDPFHLWFYPDPIFSFKRKLEVQKCKKDVFQSLGVQWLFLKISPILKPFFSYLLYFPFWRIPHCMWYPSPTKKMQWIRSSLPPLTASFKHSPAADSWKWLCRLCPIHKGNRSRRSMQTENLLDNGVWFPNLVPIGLPLPRWNDMF